MTVHKTCSTVQLRHKMAVTKYTLSDGHARDATMPGPHAFHNTPANSTSDDVRPGRHRTQSANEEASTHKHTQAHLCRARPPLTLRIEPIWT